MAVFTWTLNALVHVTVIISILSLLGASLALAFGYGKPSEFEIVLRLLAIVSGFLIYAGSRAIDVSMPQLILMSIDQGGLTNNVIKSFAFPAGAGIISTWFMINGLKSNSTITVRVSLMLVTFVLVLLVDSYFSTYSFSNPGGINKYIVPNLVFALSSVMYAVFFLKPSDLSLSAS